MSVFLIDEAARLLGVSNDTVRHWTDTGQLATTATKSGQCGVDGAELARFAASLKTAPSHALAPALVSALNQFPGLITRVIRDQVMTQVEIQAGPHRVVSLIPTEVVDQLKLKPGIQAVASVISANVIVHPKPHDRATTPR